MYSYYLNDDNETIYRFGFSIKPEEKKCYLSLLENCLDELVFVEETELKKLVEEEKVEEENKDSIDMKDNFIFLSRTIVINKEVIEDYLPVVITLKTKKYFFLRPYTIYMLIELLSKELVQSDNSYIAKIVKILNNYGYIDFSLISTIFLDQFGNIKGERFYDYSSLINLLKNLEVKITEKYSRSALSTFWQGDDAERELAEGIVTDSKANKEAIMILKRTIK